MPPKKRARTRGKKGNQARATSEQAPIPTSESPPLRHSQPAPPEPVSPQPAPPVPTSPSAPPSGHFNFFGLSREVRDMIYTYWLPCREHLMATIGECAVQGGSGKILQWSIRIRPVVPLGSILVNHQFYDEVLPTYARVATVVLRVDRRILDPSVSLPPPPPSWRRNRTDPFSAFVGGVPTTVVTNVDPLVAKIPECLARMDITTMQCIASREFDYETARRAGPDWNRNTMAAIESFKGRLFEALNHMTSLVAVKVEIFRTEAFIERWAAGIAPLAEFAKLKKLQWAKVVFTNEVGEEELLHEFHRGMILPETEWSFPLLTPREWHGANAFGA